MPHVHTAYMEFREAEPDDAAAIREVARESLQASYSLSPSTIDDAVERWYGADAVEEKTADEEDLLLVAEDDGEVVAFSESVLVGDRGDVQWLHVAPGRRGEGIGDSLYERTDEYLRERGAETIRGRVLQDNAEGNEFYERYGLTKVGETEVDIGDDTYVENVYVEEPDQRARMRVVTGPGDRELFVDEGDADRGADGPFYVVYSDPEGQEKYGYLCGACDSLANSMDSMGRIECESCGNFRKPTRWDAAYL